MKMQFKGCWEGYWCRDNWYWYVNWEGYWCRNRVTRSTLCWDKMLLTLRTPVPLCYLTIPKFRNTYFTLSSRNTSFTTPSPPICDFQTLISSRNTSFTTVSSPICDFQTLIWLDDCYYCLPFQNPPDPKIPPPDGSPKANPCPTSCPSCYSAFLGWLSWSTEIVDLEVWPGSAHGCPLCSG